MSYQTFQTVKIARGLLNHFTIFRGFEIFMKTFQKLPRHHKNLK